MSSSQKAYYDSPMGFLEIKVIDDYVCSILFVEKQKSSSQSHPLLTETISQLQEYFRGDRMIFDLPLKQQGTNFQLKVWSELLNIPFGKTYSYLQLSKKTGNVKAIRAVGTTNGKNMIAIVVPCHRVIGSDGSLTGYAGGLWRKQWLLDHEKNLVSKQQVLF